MRVARPVILNSEQKQALEQCARARSLPLRLVERARIVLLAAGGKQDKEIAAELNSTAHKVARWRKRYLDSGMEGLEKDAPRPGRTPSIPPATVKKVIHKTTQERTAHATHWSTRSMAAEVGVSETTVRRIWHKHGPQAASGGGIQSLYRSAIRREVGGHRRPVSESAGARPGVVLRREEPDSGSGSHAAGTAVETRTRGHHDARLQTQRNGHAVCRAPHSGRQGDQPQERHRHQEWLRFLR